MTQLLREALTRRNRVWGQQNDAVLRLVRSGKAENRHWPIRPQHALGCGCYITRIPIAA